MAAIENEHLVVNVVYTGPPLAGKTQSVRALVPMLMGQGSERTVLSPGDWHGRTAFFDWAVYEGGAYEGKSIQCRIISTPGQVALSARREMLLRSADAVILVVESQPEALERAIHCYEEMAPWLAESSRDVPVRVVLQCNKQDLPGSLSADELSRRLGVPCGKDVYPTSASTGKGLRSAFVAGVRNAVERARALVARGLVLNAPDIASGEELFERMQRQIAAIDSVHPAPVGSASAMPSASAPAAPTPASRPARTPRPGSERPNSARSPRRSKTDSTRASGGRGSSKAPPAGSAASGSAASGSAAPGSAAPGSGSSRSASPGRARPAADKGGASAASMSFGTSKPKSNSGFYPATAPHSSSSPERSSTSHPPLPPDHPFAPMRPSTRRSGAGSSRPASRPSSSAAPGTGGATAPTRSRDKAAPPNVDDKAAREVTAPLRSGRAAGPKAPSADAVAARSSANAKSSTTPRGDARQSLTTLAARAAAEAAIAHAPAPLESPASSAVSRLVPAAGAPGSAPPSSATASAPASSARRAIIPPNSEPGAHAPGSARAPSPASASSPLTRPLIFDGSGSSAAHPEGAPADVPGINDDPVDSGWPEAGEVLSMAPPFAAPVQQPNVKKPRPAVMPASAWRARVERGELSDDSVRAAADPSPGAAASGAASDRPGAAAVDSDNEWPAQPSDGQQGDARAVARSLRLLRGGTPKGYSDEPHATAPRPSLTLLDRPAVMPAGAWRAALEAEAERARVSEAAVAGDASASAPPTQPSEGHSANDTPTLAPPSDLLLSSERPTIVAGALAGPPPAADQSTAPPGFADPATFGLESSRLVEPYIGPGFDASRGLPDESNESFRIPETPPGLQAFVAKARLSTPPPPAASPSDDVIPSLAPSPSPAETEAATTGSEPHEPVEFAGPRMPGHARAPRAVWRRSTWRTLEMHINSDATALEDARGRWIGELAPGWYARTLRSAPDARSARRAFAEEVLRERRLGSYLSRPRCVALTEEADRFWIWQAACRVPTLAAVLGRRLAARESPSAMAEALLDASLAFVEARQRFIQARVPLPLSLHALSVQADELVYSGLLPDPGAAFIHPPSDGHTAFEDALRKKWPSTPVDGSAVFAELSSKAAGRLPEPLLAIIRSVVGQSSVETSANGVSG
jgi:signal recognition particle receptor subunit beta